MKTEELIMYGLVFVGVLVVGLAAMTFFSEPKIAYDVQGKVIQSAANQQVFAQQAAVAGSDCGSLTDTANVQHLSHHPGQYEQCLRQVDPGFLKQATGQTLELILGN